MLGPPRCRSQLILLVLATCLATVTARAAAARNSAGGGSQQVVVTSARHEDPLHRTTSASSHGDSVCVKPDLCTCRFDTADCSHHYGRLTYVPALPARIKHLIFSYNNLTSIASDAFFRNAPQLMSIDLQHNGLQHVSPGAFARLTILRILKLDYNRLTYSDLASALSATRLQQLSLRYMDLGPPDAARFPRSVTMIDLTGNKIKHLNFSVFQPLLYLSGLRLAGSRISVITPGFLPRLERLDLSTNVLLDFPASCSKGSSLFPRLSYLNVTANSLSVIPSEVCLPQLNNLVLNNNRFSEFKTDTFNARRFPNLTTLSLESMKSLQSIEQFAFRNPSLTTLTLMFCNVAFSDATIHPNCFAGLPKLTMLQVSHNLGSYIPDEKFDQLFGSLSNLEKLYMGALGLLSVNEVTFSKLTKLTDLKLHRNELSDLPDGMFDHLVDLKNLVLGDNQFRTIRKTLFSAATRQRLRNLDLSGNPFVCDCDLLWFRDWFISTPALFDKSFRNYRCGNRVNGTLLAQFSLREQVCLMSHQASALIIACAVLLVTVVTAVSVCWQYRWHIRLLLYESFRGRGEGRRRRLLETGAFDYDMFVSYAQPDLWWVRHHLMPRLEDGLGLKLCVHERDFIPGNNIVDNIMECVQSSKKIMMVFSREFIRSQWCQFELALCLRHVVETDDVLIVVCLEDAMSLEMTSTMMAVLKITNYIQWDENPDAVAAFWGRIAQALNEIAPGDA